MLIVMFMVPLGHLHARSMVHAVRLPFKYILLLLNIPPLMLKSLIIFAIFLFSIIGHIKIILF